jgi:hypothetical protein
MIERCPRSIYEKIRKEFFSFGNSSGFLAYFKKASIFLAVQAVSFTGKS